MNTTQNVNHIKRSKKYTPPRILLVLTAIVAIIGPQCSAMPSPLEGKAAPAFSLKLMDGGVFNLEEHLGKRPIVLDFWAVWCPPCREAIPKVASALNEFKGKDVVILTVNLGDSAESIAAFLESKSVQVPVALDEGNAVGGLYHVRSIPTMVFIGRDGKVSQVTVGSLPESTLRSSITALL